MLLSKLTLQDLEETKAGEDLLIQSNFLRNRKWVYLPWTWHWGIAGPLWPDLFIVMFMEKTAQMLRASPASHAVPSTLHSAKGDRRPWQLVPEVPLHPSLAQSLGILDMVVMLTKAVPTLCALMLNSLVPGSGKSLCYLWSTVLQRSPSLVQCRFFRRGFISGTAAVLLSSLPWDPSEGGLLLGGLSSGGGSTGKFLEKQICAGREKKGQQDGKSGCERAIGPGAGDGREERHSPTPSVSLRAPGLAMLEQRFSTVFSIWLSWGDWSWASRKQHAI